MQLLMLLMTAVVPLAMAPGVVSAFDITPKIAVLLLCDAAVLLFCKTIVNDVRGLFETGAGKLYVGCIGGLWLSAAASTLASSNRALSIAGSSWRRDGLVTESAILLFALLAAAWIAADRGRIRIVLRAAVVSGGIGALYGVAQYFGWDPWLPSQAYESGEGPFTIVRPPGTLGHADYFANWLVMVVFMALALSRLDASVRWRTMARVSMGLSVFAIVLSGTRSALLGVLVGALVFVVMARPKIERKAVAIMSAGLVCLGVLIVSPAGAKLRARVHWSLDDVRGGARMLLWRDSLRMAVERPVLGFGPETFTSQFPPFESTELSRAYPDFYHESPHNMFLDVLTSRGIPGALILIGLCVLALWSARKNAAFAAGLAGAVICQQFMVLTIPTELYFYLLIAMIIGQSAPLATKRDVFHRTMIPVAAAIAIGFVVFGVRLILADRAMAVAERRILSGDVAGAASSYRTMQYWSSQIRDSDLRYSIAMTRLARTTTDFQTSVAAAQQASESAIRATGTAEDRQNAWYNLAMIAALRNDRAGVENALRQAVACAPNWFKPHWTLSQLLELTGRHEEARREATLAKELDGSHDPEVTETSKKILGDR
jgi:O-antigen ligase